MRKWIHNRTSGNVGHAGRIDAAKAQVSGLAWSDVDVIEVPNGKNNKGNVIAIGLVSGGWSDDK